MTGKEKCYEMKRMREKIAKDNDIEGFEFKECTFDGECQGYCPVCDNEAMKLREILIKKNAGGPYINKINKSEPSFPVTKGLILPPNIQGGIRPYNELPPDAVGGLSEMPYPKTKQKEEKKSRETRGIFGFPKKK